ncbi:hypothetical protein SISNIDRAFT_489556 [Sistotremastrum niveocremeum HHB9708]|uniref:Uncharacterized protein n=1 Tax=Sistotremastrum niveocremeum HHB9708 TaxID=1314777 RepID=A0A164PXF8_9AGAM|nr:hypothetical protein SISNIDRAFT_489556 [Sistotremastrum niveocremeum HHB9708]
MKKARWATKAVSKSIACPGYSVVDLEALFLGKQPDTWRVAVIFRRKRNERLSRREEGVCFGAWDRDNDILDRSRHPVSLKGAHWSDCATEIRFGWPGVVHEKFMINLKDCHVDYVFWQMYGITEQLLESESVQRAKGRTLNESLSMDTLILCRLKQVDVNAWQPVFMLEEPTNIGRRHSRHSSLQASPRNLPRSHTPRRHSETLTVMPLNELTGFGLIRAMSPASQTEDASASRTFTPLPTEFDTSSGSELEFSPAATSPDSSLGLSNWLTLVGNRPEVENRNLQDSLSASDMSEIQGEPSSSKYNLEDIPTEDSWISDPLQSPAVADSVDRHHSAHLTTHLLPPFEWAPQNVASEACDPSESEFSGLTHAGSAQSSGRDSLSVGSTAGGHDIRLSWGSELGCVRLEMPLTLYERLHAQGLPREFPAPTPAPGSGVEPGSLHSTVLDNDFVLIDQSVGTEDSLSQLMWEALRNVGGEFT